MISDNSRLQVLEGGNTYLGVNSMHFFNVFVFRVFFLGGGEFGILGGVPER